MKVYEESRKRLMVHRKEHNTRVRGSLDMFVYWTSLLILAFFNLLSIFMLIPFLVLFKGGIVYVFVIAFGLVLGILFNLLLHGIQHLEAKHHVIAAIFIPTMAVIDLVFILFVTEQISHDFLRPLTFSSSFTMAAFISAFILPYLFTVSMRQKK